MSRIGMVAPLLSAMLLFGCSGRADSTAAPGVQNKAGQQEKELIRMEKPSGTVPPHRGVATSSDPRDFDTLDDYLAQLERLGATGQSWYREVRPGTYQLVTTMAPAPAPRQFTRAQLMAQFGFAR